MHCMIFTTAGSLEEAGKIAHTLVDARLAACVNIIPQVHSVYRWLGDVQTADEVLLMVKTTTDRSDAVRRKIIELHSYDLPECIAVDITAGSEPYLAWITDSTR
jgi:periplasmic divalent cation tolerance protein